MMFSQTRLSQIGNSLGVILPKEQLAHFQLQKGDTVYIKSDEHGIQISPYDPNFAEELELGREFMAQYRDTFKALAK